MTVERDVSLARAGQPRARDILVYGLTKGGWTEADAEKLVSRAEQDAAALERRKTVEWVRDIIPQWELIADEASTLASAAAYRTAATMLLALLDDLGDSR